MNIKIYLLSLVLILSCNKNKTQNNLDKIYNESQSAYLSLRSPINNLEEKLSKTKVESNDDSIKIEIIKAQDFMIKSKWESAIKFYKSAIKLLQNSKTDSLHIAAYFGIASPYLQLGDYDQSLSWYITAEKYAIKINSKINMYRSYFAIAQLFQMKGDLKNATIFLNKSIHFITKNDVNNYYNAQLTLANIYGMSNQFDSALAIDNKNLKELEGKNLAVYESFFYNNKGNCYLYNNQFDSSEKYLLKCLSIDLSLKDSKQISDSYSCLMNLYATKNDSIKLKNISSKAIEYANETNLFGAKQQTYESLVTFYKNKNNYAEALKYEDSAFSNYKKGLNEKSENRISELKIAFETDKKEVELAKHKEEILKQRILIIAVILLLILLVILFYNFYSKSKIKRELELKKIEQKQIEIANSLIFETEQLERKRIANDLHDSVGQKLSVVKMQLSTQKVNIPFISNLLDESINEVRTISHNLVPYDIEKGLFNAIQQLADQINFSNNKTEIIFTYENVLQIDKNIELICYRIIQEIVNNALKHANANNITIQLKINTNVIKIIIEDNGKGMDLNSTKTNGIGLQNIKNRVVQLNGKLEFDSKINKGTSFKIDIPFDKKVSSNFSI